MKKHIESFLLAVAPAFALSACGAGVPVQLRIDEFTMTLDMDEAVGQMQAELSTAGLLPPGTRHLPAVWPESLPDIKYSLLVETDPLPVDLTPEPGSEEAAKYEDINSVKDAIRRIEINQVVLRVERSNLTLDLPALTLQAADDPNTSPANRRAWISLGALPAIPAGTVGDTPFEMETAGEAFLNSQLGDDAKELALRARGRLEIDTAVSPRLPTGKAQLRVIVVATFFVEPEKAL